MKARGGEWRYRPSHSHPQRYVEVSGGSLWAQTDSGRHQLTKRWVGGHRSRCSDEPRIRHVCVWQPTWYRVTTPKFLLNLQTNEMWLKCEEGELSGQTMVARYTRCSVYSTLTWQEEYSRLAQPFRCWGYRESGESQEVYVYVYEHYIPSLLNTSGGGDSKPNQNLFYMNTPGQRKWREEEEEDVSSYWVILEDILLEIGRSTRSRSAESLLWKTYYRMNESRTVNSDK